MRTPEPTIVVYERHGHHNAIGNYLGHPCFGKLYHLAVMILEQK
jgi:hypothetical protein